MQVPQTETESPPKSAIEARLLAVAGILDQAVAAVNQAIEDLRITEDDPEKGRHHDDL